MSAEQEERIQMLAFISQVRQRPELLILLLVLTIIAMLVVPLPTFLVDFLLGTNIVIALLVFMGSFYIERILNFSSFPSVLLITTLFRLALSISTSRLILLEADAGKIISTFGQFVIGDSLVVGFVIFFIVTIVQFIVITKGSERVAEVAARFSLDAMPGKQMSIDADLKAGVVDADGAKERRSILEKESQLYGSFDGAMKFIKGDAIAGIIIIFVNFIGGVSVGMGQHGMDLSTALSTYTILTIGDGLVAQIPALLIAISAGFIVTRVNGEGNNLGQNIMSQLLGSPFVLIVTAVLALGIGTLPGFPFVAFLILSVSLGGLYALKKYEAKKKADKEKNKSPVSSGEFSSDGKDLDLDNKDDVERYLTATTPLILLCSEKQQKQIEKLNLSSKIRQKFFVDFGVKLPELAVHFSAHAAENQVTVLLNEVKAAQYTILFDLLCLINDPAELVQMKIPLQMADGRNGQQTAWISPVDLEGVKALGYVARSAEDELYHHLTGLLSRAINEFFGVQETKNLMDQLEAKFPDLVKEAYRHATVQRIAEVLQRLIQEKISIRNMKMVLEALAQWAPREKDVIALVECVRGALARYISQKFSLYDELRVVVLSPEIEEVVRQGVRQSAGGVFLNLDPADSERIIDRLSVGLDSIRIAQKDLVLVASVDIRRFVKRLIESRFDELEVLSFAEISDSVNVNVIKTI
jgi:type III secretion protein V